MTTRFLGRITGLLLNKVLFFLGSWLPVVGWAWLIYFLSAIPSLSTGLGMWDLAFRKLAHVVEFFVLTRLLIRAFGRSWPMVSKGRALWTTATLALFYAISDEYHQGFVVGRVASVKDVLFDLVGIGGAILFYQGWPRVMRVRAILPLFLLFIGCGPQSEFKRIQALEKKGDVYEAWQSYQVFAAKNARHELAPKALYRAGVLTATHLNDCGAAAAFFERILERYPQSDPWARLAVLKKTNCPDYFPLSSGGSWVEGDSETGGKNARIEITCKAEPAETGALVTASYEKTYYGGNAKFQTTLVKYEKTENELHEFPMPDDPRPKIILKWPLLVGTKWKTRVADKIIEYEILAVDKNISVKAGEFQNCLLVESREENASATTNEYYAPNIGRVLTTLVSKGGESRITELLSTNLPLLESEDER